MPDPPFKYLKNYKHYQINRIFEYFPQPSYAYIYSYIYVMQVAM